MTTGTTTSMTTARARAWRAAALTVLSVALLVSMVAPWAGGPLLALAFVVLVPGSAVVPLWRFEDPFDEMVLSAALSIAIGTAVALVMLALDLWYPQVATAALAVLSIPSLALQVLRRTEDDRAEAAR